MPSKQNNPCLTCSINQGCCSQISGLRLSKEEFEKYFNTHSGELEIVKYRKTFVISSRNKGPCPYWHKNGCMIYNDRPIDCRLYPYEITRISEKRKTIEVTAIENPGCPQKDHLLMSSEEAKALIEVFCQNAYGRNKSILIKYVQAGMGSSPFFVFLDSIRARLSKSIEAFR